MEGKMMYDSRLFVEELAPDKPFLIKDLHKNEISFCV